MCVRACDLHAHSQYFSIFSLSLLCDRCIPKVNRYSQQSFKSHFSVSLIEALQTILKNKKYISVYELLLMHWEEVAVQASSDGKPGGSLVSLSSAGGAQVENASAGRRHVSGLM